MVLAGGALVFSLPLSLCVFVLGLEMGVRGVGCGWGIEAGRSLMMCRGSRNGKGEGEGEGTYVRESNASWFEIYLCRKSTSSI